VSAFGALLSLLFKLIRLIRVVPTIIQTASSHPKQSPPAAPPSAQQVAETKVETPGIVVIRNRGVFMVGLQLGDHIIPLRSLPQVFGRYDFKDLIPSPRLMYIGRTHFRIDYDYSQDSFTVEDLGRVNGTFVDGEDIRGKGPVPLKDGSIINPAGVADLCFVAKKVVLGS